MSKKVTQEPELITKEMKAETEDIFDLPPDALLEDEEDDSSPAKITVRTHHLPADVYYDADGKELERLIPYLIGKELAGKIKALAVGRNVQPLALLRQGIASACELGCWDAIDATEKRNGNDERPEHVDNRRILAALGQSNYFRVVSSGRERKVSNLSALQAGVQYALDRGGL